jgi:hypothetical protein
MKRRDRKLLGNPNAQSPAPKQIKNRACAVFRAHGGALDHELDDWNLAKIVLNGHENADPA